MTSVEHRLSNLFKDVFDLSDGFQITDETSPETIEDWDSLAHINLIMAIEQEFSIKFSMEEVPKMVQFSTIVQQIDKKGGV